MICLQIHKKELLDKVSGQLEQQGVHIANASGSGPNGLNYFYDRRVKAVIVERNSPGIHNQLWSDILTNVARRVPVLVLLDSKQKPKYLNHLRGVTFSNTKDLSDDELTNFIMEWLSPVLGDETFIPSFDERFIKEFIREQKFIHMLRIDGTLFNKIETQYGKEAFQRAKTQFRKVLTGICNAENFLPEGQLFCSDHDANLFYLILPKRLLSTYSSPGKLEQLANDLCFRIQSELWRVMYLPNSKRPIPIQQMPLLTIGHTTSVHNICIDDNINLQKSLERAKDNSDVQMKRVLNRRSELIQAIVLHPDMLVPKFQGIFELSKIKSEVLDVNSPSNLLMLAPHTLGFESLVRLDVEQARKIIEPAAEAMVKMENINPDVLFSLAKSVKFNLELDQVCVKQAMKHGLNLPGALMINILPRNLYNFDVLQELVKASRDIIFEVSEAEAINNFDLMIKIRADVKRMNMRIAADDFGVGYAGFDRVIQLEPDIIKLDRSLVSNIHVERSKKGFVQGLIDAAKKLDAKILAEGVENIAELEVLRSMGVEYVQGFLLHRPESAPHILSQLNIEYKNKEEESGLKKLEGAA